MKFSSLRKIESFFGEAVYNNSTDNIIDERRLTQLEDYNNRINTDISWN